MSIDLAQKLSVRKRNNYFSWKLEMEAVSWMVRVWSSVNIPPTLIVSHGVSYSTLGCNCICPSGRSWHLNSALVFYKRYFFQFLPHLLFPFYIFLNFGSITDFSAYVDADGFDGGVTQDTMVCFAEDVKTIFFSFLDQDNFLLSYQELIKW